MNELEQLHHNLTNHPPVGGHVIEAFEEVRAFAMAIGEVILEVCPPSRERSLALTNLEQTVMWAMASIDRNQEAV